MKGLDTERGPNLVWLEPLVYGWKNDAGVTGFNYLTSFISQNPLLTLLWFQFQLT